jgi:UDP-N-acetylglucosamine 2-epimerase (non-hydrolysing)
VSELISEVNPQLVIVQGDTTTAFTAGLAAFYAQVPIAHVEAGLRTGDLRHPFPEEANRRLLARITDLHLAPTPSARANLLREGVDPATVYVTGNTVIDALLRTVSKPAPESVEPLVDAARGRRLLLVTAHRRESWGAPMRAIGQALAELAARDDTFLVVAAHRNPIVRADLLAPLDGLDNVRITEPLAYPEFSHLLRVASLILTDSGGVQEEAPSVGTPVLVLRQTTERQEAIDAGVAQLVGMQTDVIVQAAAALLDSMTDDSSAQPMENPFGDGKASGRVVSAIKQHLGVGVREPEFLGITR